MTGRVPVTTDGGALPLPERLQIDAICDRFEAAWRAGEAPDLADFLTVTHGPAHDRLFRELLALDLEFRLEQGETPEADTYLSRFPEHCETVHAAIGGTDSIEAGPTRLGATLDQTRPSAAAFEGDPATIGALRAAGYEVIGELGRGGMGVVYRAWQLALSRTVALKVIKSGGFASTAERRRFQNEAEAVAQLDHPNIVPIYEVGESQGLQYFSMKLIAGTGLDNRRDDYRNDPRATAGLLAIVARAVDHAHRRGILHRDLKPANILVDEQGAPHVTDFGLARRVDAANDLTHSGAIVGTPSYMSPEQAVGGKGSLTTSTDVYGLGSVLYALLTGRAPHGGSSLAETLDRVRAEPPKPPSQVNRAVPRDLEVICLKCLEKEPQRRYASAGDLADDLTRWLAGEPIAARPVGSLAKGWMWCRRHPVPASLSAMLALALVLGFVGVTWKWREADHERAVKTRVEEFWTERVLAGSSTEVNPRGAKITLRDVLELAASRVKGDFGDEPEVEAEIHQTAGEAYRSLGEYSAAEEHLRAALALNTAMQGPRGRKTLRSANALADLLDRSEKRAEAKGLAQKNAAMSFSAFGPDDPLTLTALHNLGVLYWHLGDWANAEPLLRETLAARRRVLPTDHPDTLATIRALELLLQERGKLDEAESLANEYEHGIRCARGPNHPDNVTALANLGLLRHNQGRDSEAEDLYRRAWDEARRILGDEHPVTLDAAVAYTKMLLRDNRKVGEGVEVLRGVVQSMGHVWGDDHPKTRDARAALGRAEKSIR